MPRDASPASIKQAFNALVLFQAFNHPDKGNFRGEENFRQLELSYEVLSDAAAKAEYDHSLQASASAAGPAASASAPSASSQGPAASIAAPTQSPKWTWLPDHVLLHPPDWWGKDLWRPPRITQEDIKRSHTLAPRIALTNTNGTPRPLYHLLRDCLPIKATEANALQALLTTAEAEEVICVPVTYAEGHRLYEAAQMPDNKERVLHGTSALGGLGIIRHLRLV